MKPYLLVDLEDDEKRTIFKPSAKIGPISPFVRIDTIYIDCLKTCATKLFPLQNSVFNGLMEIHHWFDSLSGFGFFKKRTFNCTRKEFFKFEIYSPAKFLSKIYSPAK